MSVNSGQRRKDFVAYVAVGLFVVIVVMEILLVTWLPRKLITKELWEREEAQQELVELVDKLRRNMRGGSIRCANFWQEGEVAISLDCLDEAAKYLRENQDKMDRAQIRCLYNLVRRFEVRYCKWDEGKFCVSFERIDIEPLLRRTLDKYNEQIGTDGKTGGKD